MASGKMKTKGASENGNRRQYVDGRKSYYQLSTMRYGEGRVWKLTSHLQSSI